MTMTMNKPVKGPSTRLRVVSLSDVHLYHPRVPDEHIIEVLDGIFCDDEHAPGIDIISIAGDLFDRGVPFGDAALTPIVAWQARLLRFCERHDIVLRILYGTPRHDRKQSARFNDLVAALGVKIDFKYVSTLSIEYMSKFGIHVLYIPDEWRTDPAVTLSEVKQEMAARQIEQVDLAFMHGCFGFQLPPIEKIQAKTHNTAEYLALVRYQIFIGHHHTFTTHEHICAHGSTTRLKQGEEEPKGFVVWDLLNDDKWIRTFVENKSAWTFKTIQASEMSFTELVTSLREMNLRKGSFIDIEADPSSECSRLFKSIVGEFHGINMGLKRPKKKVDAPVDHQPSDGPHVVVQIGQNNIKEMVTAWLIKKEYSPSLIQRAGEVMDYEQSIFTQ